MVTKKRVVKEEVQEETIEELKSKFELSVSALIFARDAMQHMSERYGDLLKEYKKAIKHIDKLERKLEKAK
jgi:hypothetical protein